MTEPAEAWTAEGVGNPPRAAWSFSTEGQLTHLAVAWEADETLTIDATGGIYRLDREGRLRQVTRGLSQIDALAFADNGACAVVGYEERKVSLLDSSLSITWTMNLYDRVVGLAVDPHGRHFAVALANRDVRIYTTSRRRIAEIEPVRPLKFMRFSATAPALVGAAEDGLLAAYDISGRLLWDQRLFTTCGGMTASGDLSTILLAGFAHGIQRFGGSGTNRGSFVIEGTPSRLATSYDASRVVVATLERQVFWLDRGGHLKWASMAPDDVAAVACDAPGRKVTIGFANGRVARLAWQ